MPAYIGPPRSRLGRGWNELVHTHRLARWVDEWWYERGRVPCEVGSFICEGMVYAVGFIVGLPAFVVVTAARLMSNLDELHIMSRALIRRDFSIFDKAQTWQRMRDGSQVRVDVDDGPTMSAASPAARIGHSARQFVSDFWTERRRLPGFIVGIGSPVLAFTLGAVFHAPLLVVGVVTYATVALRLAPVVRNGILSALHGTMAYVNRPQTVPRRPRVAAKTHLDTPAVAGPDVPLGPAPVARPAPSAPSAASTDFPEVGRSRSAAVVVMRVGRPEVPLDL